MRYNKQEAIFNKICTFIKTEYMKTITVAEFEAGFAAVITQVKNGEEIEVCSTEGQQEIVGYFLPANQRPHARKIGIMEGKASVIFHDDYTITENEFLGL
jgi:antitoxin (DNA-binding transcriptional repressor) of toxin-antitoxin stability system